MVSVTPAPQVVAAGERRDTFVGRVAGVFGVAVLITAVTADQLRLALPGQPLALSFIPLGVGTVGGAWVLASGGLRELPQSLRHAVAWTLVLCGYGTIVALANSLPYRQVLAGWVSYANILPTLVLGHAIGLEAAASDRVARWAGRVLLFSVGVALLQQFGVLTVEDTQLDDVATYRGVEGMGVLFRYTTGPFRTAGVFSTFLAFATVIYLSGGTSTPQRPRVPWVPAALLLLVVGASLLAARRSGLAMLLGGILPFLVLSAHRTLWRLLLVLVPLTGLALQYFFENSGQASLELQAKLAHSTTHSGALGRLVSAFEVRPQDTGLLSVLGDGLGSYGPAVRAAGAAAAARAELQLIMHPIVHFGWFKDLAAFGPFGLALHVLALGAMMMSTDPRRAGPGRMDSDSRWSAFGLAVAAAVVYFLVATSWLQSLAGGTLFGLAVGLAAGRVTAATSAYLGRDRRHA